MPPKPRQTGEPKRTSPVRVHRALYPGMHACCEKLVMDTTSLVNQAVREFLERHGCWSTELGRLDEYAAGAGAEPGELLAAAVREFLDRHAGKGK